MRILELVSQRGVNGAVYHARNFIPLLQARGHEVVLACLPDSWIERELRGSVEIVNTCFDRRRAEFRRFAELVRARDFAATHSHLTRSHNFGALLQLWSGRPNIAHAQNHHFHPHWWFQARVLAVSTATARVQRWFHFRGPRRMALLHNFVDTDRFRPVAARDPGLLEREFGVPAEATALACVAEISPRKGQLHLVRALARAAAALPRLHLVLFGRPKDEGGYAARMRGEAARLGVAARVHEAGFRRDLPAVLPHFHAAALPSLDEPFALGALEAMGCGLPLIATTVGGFPEMVSDGANGRLVRPGDAAALAAALIDVLAGEERRAAMARAARARMESEFSPQAHIERFERILAGWGIR